MAGRTSAPQAIAGFETGQGQCWTVLGLVLTIHMAPTWVRPREAVCMHRYYSTTLLPWFPGWPPNLSPLARLVHGCGNPQWEGGIHCDSAFPCHA